MLNAIIRFSVYNRGLVLILTVLLAGIAFVFGFQRLPIDAVPDITNNQVQINTTVGGLAPEEIERSITFPIESAMRGISKVESVRSITRFGLSQVTVIFADGVDIYRARQLVSERLQGVLNSLPSGAQANLGPVSTGLGEIYQYVLDFKVPAKTLNERFEQLVQLRTLHDWTIKPRLMSVAGVAEVNTIGGFEKLYQVSPRLQEMERYSLHFSDIAEALTDSNKNVGGGIVQQSSEQFLVQGVGLFTSVEDLKKIPIKQLEGLRIVRLGEVADVSLGKESRTGAATYNGEETVLGTAMMLVGENSRSTAKAVDARIREIAETLPPEFLLKTVYDRSILVDETLQTVEHNLAFGAALVILVLFLLLGNFRAALITAITIPLTLLLTFLVMRSLNISGNLMSLGALDFGIIVDGTVIILDNCVRRLKERAGAFGRELTKDEIRETVFEASVEIRSAAGFGELIIVIVFLPLFALVGIEGKMFAPMAASFVIAILMALMLSFTFAPALASLILGGKMKSRESWLMRGIEYLYSPVLNFMRRTWMIALPAAALILGLSIYNFARNGSEFLPQLGEGSFAFHMIRPVNISLDQSAELQKISERVLLDIPEVSHVFSRIGTAEIATDPMGVNVSDSYIMLKDKGLWREGMSYERLLSAVQAELDEKVPGQSYLASQPIQMRFNELLEGTRADVAIKVFGPDLSENAELAEHIQELVAKIEGAGEVELELAGTTPVLRIKPKAEAIVAYGTSHRDILSAIELAMGGQEASFMYQEDKKFPIIIRLKDEERSDIRTIRALPVALRNGSSASLGSLADIGFEDTFATVNREGGIRRASVLVNLRGRDTESFVKEAQKVVSEKIKVPEGTYIEWGGNFKNLEEARDRLMVLTPVALILVFILVFWMFGSLLETLLIFLCIPFAWIGGIWNMNWHGLPFSISAGVGFIALSGVAVLNGVVLVSFYNKYKSQGKSGWEMIREATLLRTRPVIMTAMVAAFGFLPMMFSSGMGAEVQRPLATVVTGGIFSSTILTLLLLPVTFALLEKRIRRFRDFEHSTKIIY